MKLTYLTEEDVRQLDEKRAAVSDYAIISGCSFSTNEHINNSNSLDTRTGYYWTCTSDNYGDARAVNHRGNIYNRNVLNRSVGSRPALEFSSIEEIFASGVSGDLNRISFGTYLDHAASEEKQLELNKKIKRRNLTELTDKYIRDSRKYTDCDKGFNPEEISFYQDDDGVYARVRVNTLYDRVSFKLSNGCEYRYNDYGWIKEETVYWKRLGNTLKYYSEKILYSVQFNLARNYYGDFPETDANWYLQEHFKRDLLSRSGIHIESNSKANPEYTNPIITLLKSENEILKKQIENTTNMISINNNVIKQVLNGTNDIGSIIDRYLDSLDGIGIASGAPTQKRKK